MSEIRWFPVKGYEDKYEYSESGEVRVKARDIFRHGEYVTTLEPKILSSYKDRDSNKQYVILHNGVLYQKHFLEDILN